MGARSAVALAGLLFLGVVASASAAVRAQPVITTRASIPVVVGHEVYDTAAFTGGANPTGTVTFRLYGPDDMGCRQPPVFTSTNAVSAYGTNSGPFPTSSLGTYRWTASYSGDANNLPATGACNDANESVLVSSKATPTLTTRASGPVALGGQVSDTLTLSGRLLVPCQDFIPPGEVCAAGFMSGPLFHFSLFGPDDPRCAGTPVFTFAQRRDLFNIKESETETSAPFTPTAPGTYRWTASYVGDPYNTAATGACNAPNESVVVSGPPDTTKPVLTALSLSPSSFRAAGAGPSIAAAVGSTVVYTLSEAATVTFRVERPLRGRRVRGRCVRPTRSNRRARRCTRYVTLPGSFTHKGQAGANTFRFSGRLRGRKLAPGRYRTRFQATDSAGNSSPLQRIRFRIVSR